MFINKRENNITFSEETKSMNIKPLFDKVVVEGVNIAKKALKPTQANPDGGIIEKSNSCKLDGKLLFMLSSPVSAFRETVPVSGTACGISNQNFTIIIGQW